MDKFLATEEGTHPVHVRLQQRNARKSVVTIDGLDDDLDLPRIARALRRALKASAAIIAKQQSSIADDNEAFRRAKRALPLDRMCSGVKLTDEERRLRRVYLPSPFVILMQGDKREDIKRFLLGQEIIKDEKRLIIHGT